mmetsp:Transcript_16495/g.43631  ORF Transcript_16495/g.43631 Transcript_16495/m.43631 type:complete len:299 (-) Transcript_16495:2-898(-)
MMEPPQLCGAVEHQLDVQPVVAQQHAAGRRCPASVAHNLRRVLQAAGGRAREVRAQAPIADLQALHVLPLPRGGRAAQREVPGQEGVHKRKGVQGPGLRPRPRRRGPEDVGGVDGVEEGAPAGVARVEHEAGLVDRAHELGPSDGPDLRVHVAGASLHLPLRRALQVADASEELHVLAVAAEARGRRLGVRGVPRVDAPLHVRALLEQRRVARPELLDQPLQAAPEGLLDALLQPVAYAAHRCREHGLSAQGAHAGRARERRGAGSSSASKRHPECCVRVRRWAGSRSRVERFAGAET